MASSGFGGLAWLDSQLRQFTDAHAPLLSSADPTPVFAVFAALVLVISFLPAAVAFRSGHPAFRRLAGRGALIPLSATAFLALRLIGPGFERVSNLGLSLVVAGGLVFWISLMLEAVSAPSAE